MSSFDRDKYYVDFKWLSQQRQWRVYQQFLQEQIDGIWSSFLNGSKEDLPGLQARAKELTRVKNIVNDIIKEKENQK